MIIPKIFSFLALLVSGHCLSLLRKVCDAILTRALLEGGLLQGDANCFQ